jgi:hypothetical protein
MDKNLIKFTLKAGLNLAFFAGHHFFIKELYAGVNDSDEIIPMSCMESFLHLKIRYAHLASWTSAFLGDKISNLLSHETHYLIKDLVDLTSSIGISVLLGKNISFDRDESQYIFFTRSIPCPIPAIAYSLINSNALDKALDYLLGIDSEVSEGYESETIPHLEVF